MYDFLQKSNLHWILYNELSSKLSFQTCADLKKFKEILTILAFMEIH